MLPTLSWPDTEPVEHAVNVRRLQTEKSACQLRYLPEGYPDVINLSQLGIPIILIPFFGSLQTLIVKCWGDLK